MFLDMNSIDNQILKATAPVLLQFYFSANDAGFESRSGRHRHANPSEARRPLNLRFGRLLVYLFDQVDQVAQGLDTLIQ